MVIPSSKLIATTFGLNADPPAPLLASWETVVVIVALLATGRAVPLRALRPGLLTAEGLFGAEKLGNGTSPSALNCS
jgi:hypothetical protein